MEDVEIYDNLIKKIKEYHPSNDFTNIEKAYKIAQEAHGTQLRKSGEPYIIHPLSVALILAELELDRESIISGILHDVIEDTIYTYDDISRIFGQEVADIVDGVTKLEGIEVNLKSSSLEGKDKNYREELQAENYRKMFLAMAKDIRVILIKIADRLHNLRTLKYMSPEKQKEKAQETLDIYCPLAHRLGISKLRHELEDLSFRYLHPEDYFEISEQISRKQSERLEYIQRIVLEIKEKMSEIGIECTVEGRPKHFFSIYKKMKSQNKTLDQLYDLFAVRIILVNNVDCYAALGLVHQMYTPMPGRFKDYIAMPKPNKYQSLHTGVIGPEGEPVEIQIRTIDMHKTSEFGIAAHWRYKEGSLAAHDTDDEKNSWLGQILDWQRELSDNSEFLTTLKVDLDVFNDQVYCFTPKGEIINLAFGSTPIDFAYAIHSAVGNKMIGARVNGKIATFDFQLSSGDRVDIITSQNSKGPSRDWLNIVKTSQAKNKINQWFKKENKEENYLKGKEMLERDAKKKGYVFSVLLSNERKEIVLNKFAFLDWQSICSAIGHGSVKEGQVVNRLIEDYEKEQVKLNPPPVSIEDVKVTNTKNKNKKSGIIIKGIGQTDCNLKQCCNPVPGDEIVAYTTRGRGASIHRTDCLNIINMSEIERLRLIEAEWAMDQKDSDHITYLATIKVICRDRMNLFNDISSVFLEEKIAVRTLNCKPQDDNSIFDIGFMISNRSQMDRVRSRLNRLPDVLEITRVTS